mmetsp:Transcript_6092/g.18768  ORF Transcript_6092/g.18768 Transcript_6092/m.18768 type:complete len:206 (+) Transcript_6092:518-1135(+)
MSGVAGKKSVPYLSSNQCRIASESGTTASPTTASGTMRPPLGSTRFDGARAANTTPCGIPRASSAARTLAEYWEPGNTYTVVRGHAISAPLVAVDDEAAAIGWRGRLRSRANPSWGRPGAGRRCARRVRPWSGPSWTRARRRRPWRRASAARRTRRTPRCPPASSRCATARGAASCSLRRRRCRIGAARGCTGLSVGGGSRAPKL